MLGPATGERPAVKEPCPQCGAALKHHGTKQVGAFIVRNRDCTRCDFADKAWFQPEEIVRTEKRQKTIRRRIVRRTQTAEELE